MGRRRRSNFRRLKGWPLLIVLAGIYWAREHLGITDVSDLNTLSESALPIALILIALAFVWLVIRLLTRRGKEEGNDE